jgi:signal peptidase I
MRLRWFLSGKVRQASDLCRHVRKLLAAQCDILSPQAVGAVSGAVETLETSIRSDADTPTLTKQSEDLEKSANKWLKPYPHAEWRENVEVFLVAIVVAMGIRTFFLQPFKIPTGSMQPTLYGVVIKDLRDDKQFQMPGFFTKMFDAVASGVTYHEVIAQDDGEVVRVEPVRTVMRFINKQTILVRYASGAEAPINLWFAPDDGVERHGCVANVFHRGEPLIRFKETTGDHLFVDRFTYNFRRPDRGEIIVFKTRGILGIQNQDQFYIKRLVGLPGETISIGEDRHVRINGRRLDASTPHFENVYSFDPKTPARSSQYSGHTLDFRSEFSAPDHSYTIPEGRYFAMGDNTVDSADSRYWGALPQENVIGKSWFVYWPVIDLDPEDGRRPSARQRFGWGQR